MKLNVRLLARRKEETRLRFLTDEIPLPQGKAPAMNTPEWDARQAEFRDYHELCRKQQTARADYAEKVIFQTTENSNGLFLPQRTPGPMELTRTEILVLHYQVIMDLLRMGGTMTCERHHRHPDTGYTTYIRLGLLCWEGGNQLHMGPAHLEWHPRYNLVLQGHNV